MRLVMGSVMGEDVGRPDKNRCIGRQVPLFYCPHIFKIMFSKNVLKMSSVLLCHKSPPRTATPVRAVPIGKVGQLHVHMYQPKNGVVY